MRRWANDRDQVQVHRLHGSPKPFIANVRDVGHRTDGHTIQKADGSADRTFLEEQMSEIEGLAARAITDLDAGAHLDEGSRDAIGWFLSLQWSRHRHLLNVISSGVSHDAHSHAEAQSGLLKMKLFPLLSARVASADPDAHHQDQWDHVVGELSGFEWHVVRFRQDALVLGDNILCLHGVQPGRVADLGPAWAWHGFGVPIRNAARCTIPLGPRLGLLLTPSGGPARLDAADFNRRTVFNSREFVLHQPNWRSASERLPSLFSEALERQRWAAGVFITGPY